MFGVIGSHDADASRGAVRRMGDAMKHGPSFSVDVLEFPPLGLTVGWVTDRESAEGVPVWNASSDVCLIFLGEDFREPSEIERLRLRAGTSATANDASHLVQHYEESGDSFLESINGWFGGVLIDLRQRKVLLFNDRFGLRRIYYCEGEGGLCFATEAKSLLAAAPALRKLDHTALAETFAMGCVLQNRTLFPEISLLPSAARWVFWNGRVTKGHYFHPRQWQDLPSLTDQQYYERLKDVMSRVVPRYFNGQRPVAMSLTGGFDSRIALAWAKTEPGSLPCYSFNGVYRDCADVRIARKVAQVLQHPHETISVGTSFLSEFPELAQKVVYVSDGTMDVSGAVELYVNRIAREIAPVRITGNYGSEIVRGHVAFRPSAFPRHLLDPDFADLIDQASSTYAQERAGRTISFIAFKQVPWHHFGRLSVEQSQLVLRSPYLDNELVSLIHQAPGTIQDDPSMLFQLTADGDPRLAEIATDRGFRYRAPAGLNKFEQYWREFLVKAEYAYDYGMPHSLSKVDRILAPLKLERLFLGRNKFYHFRIWYRDNLASYVKEILLDQRSRKRPHVNGSALESMINEHVEGKANYTSEIHRLLTAELLFRAFIDQDGP